MVNYTENAIKAMEELSRATKKCDFNAVKLAAGAMRFLDGALNNNEITTENYYTMIDRLGMMADNIAHNCTCTKRSR